MDTQEGASYKSDDGWKLRDPKKTKQRKMRRGKKREERRKYGHSSKRRAEYKADAQVKARAMAQAAMSGGDDTAGVNDNSYNPTGSVTEGTFQYGGSMKNKEERQAKRADRKAKRQEVKGKVKSKVKAGAKKAKAGVKKAKEALLRDNPVVDKSVASAAGDGGAPMSYGEKHSKKPHRSGVRKPKKGYEKMLEEQRKNRTAGMQKSGPKRYDPSPQRSGPSMSASQDRSASMDDYSHEKKLGADGRYDLEHGHKDWAKNDFDHAHALKKDAHHDAEQRKHAHPILKHMRRF